MPVRRSRSTITSLILLVLPLLACGLAWYYRYPLYDYWRLRNYTAPPEIAQLARNTTMTPSSQRLFYVYHPVLDDRAKFSEHCHNDEQSIVLGCYVSQKGIYIYTVTDPRLEGVQEVTAAHEMLHAAYDRLGKNERQTIDKLTSQAFAQVQNQRVRDTVETYRQKDASVVPSELHSILGTEVVDLPPALETYYQRYFTDRHQLVVYSERYEQAFTERKIKADDFYSQIKALKGQITAQEQTLETEQAELKTARQQLDDLLAAKRYDEYNARVAGFNNQVQSFNAAVADLQAKVALHNQLLESLKAVDVEAHQLLEAIDSRINTQPTQ